MKKIEDLEREVERQARRIDELLEILADLTATLSRNDASLEEQNTKNRLRALHYKLTHPNG